MDENFAGFLEDFGPAFDKRHVPVSSMDRYRGKLPDQLLAYWEDHGWCGYGKGLFWTVNPQEYEPVLEAWIGETQFMEEDAYHIIARSAFGDLYFWGEKNGACLEISAPDSLCIYQPSTMVGERMNFGVQAFFGSLFPDEIDFEDLFNPALKKLGRLKYDEMYGFVPAIALGGPTKVDNLQRVKAVEHLVILAQLAPLEIFTPPPLNELKGIVR